jgi:hypothetical protein
VLLAYGPVVSGSGTAFVMNIYFDHDDETRNDSRLTWARRVETTVGVTARPTVAVFIMAVAQNSLALPHPPHNVWCCVGSSVFNVSLSMMSFGTAHATQRRRRWQSCQANL